METVMSSLKPLDARYELLAPPEPGNINRTLFVTLRVTNTGSEEWPNEGEHPVNFAYHWRAADGTMLEMNGQRTHFPRTIQPGETLDIEMMIEPYPEPGEYLLEIDMVAEGRAWFKDLNVPSITLPITLSAPPANAPLICIVCTVFPINDAVGNQVANQMAYFVRQGYEVVVLSEAVDRRRPLEQRRHVIEIRLELLQEGETAAAKRALRILEQADRFIYHYPIYYPLMETISWIAQGIVILDYHGITPPHLWEGHNRELLATSQRRLTLAHYADYAIVHSQYTRDELLASGAISGDRVFVLPLPVSLEHFQPGERSAELAERYGIDPEQPVLLYLGRIAANKRIDVLVRALPLIRQRYPNVKLLLVGNNTGHYAKYAAEIEQLAVTLGQSEHVCFTGPVDDRELAAHYQLADVFVTASQHEGFCVPIIEAMACGVPVIGTHITALPETIGDGGLTFRPDDPDDLAAAVLRVLDGRPRAAAAEE